MRTKRDWHICAELAQHLIGRARKLCAQDRFGVEFDHSVYVLDLLLPEARAFYVMDRGFLDFARLHALDQADSFYVKRTTRNMNVAIIKKELHLDASLHTLLQTLSVTLF